MVTAGATAEDYQNGSARSTKDFIKKLNAGAIVGAVAGASLAVMLPALPSVASSLGSAICTNLGLSATAQTVITGGIGALEATTIAGDTAFNLDSIYRIGSGNSFLLEEVFQEKQTAYDVTSWICMFMTMGIDENIGKATAKKISGEAAETVGEKVAQEAVEEFAENAAKNGAENTAKGVMDNVIKEATENAEKGATENATKGATENAAKVVAENTGTKTAKETVEFAGEKSQKRRQKTQEKRALRRR